MSESAQFSPRRLLDARQVGELLGCYWRTVYRLADAGKIPWGHKLYSLREWDLAEIEAFLADGRKRVRQAGLAARKGAEAPLDIFTFCEEDTSMHVISKKRLREFWTVHPDAERPLRRWFRTATKADWQSFADVRATYGHADQVGKLTVFNVAGNKYRLIAAIHFNRGKLYVRHVLTHAEYDRGDWKED